MSERALIIHEDEASALYGGVVEQLKSKQWDLNDEGDFSAVVHLNALKEKLRAYLDDGRGEDVVELTDAGPVQVEVKEG